MGEKMIKKSVNSQLEALNRNIQYLTIESIAEEIECRNIDDSINVIKEYMQAKNYDIIGIEDKDNKKIGYLDYNNCNSGKTSDCYTKFNVDQILSKDSSLKDSIKQINEKNFMFILGKHGIEKIVTKADLAKPPVSMMYFGIIMLFEVSLSYWIDKKMPEDAWMLMLNIERQKEIHNKYNNLKNKEENINLISCSELCDKFDLFVHCDHSAVTDFSKKKLKALKEDLGHIRNKICHSDDPTTDGRSWENIDNTLEEITNITKQIIQKTNNRIF